MRVYGELFDNLIFVQWIDREGKTPLIVACMNPELIHVAKTLIELGANVNAYRPGMPVKVFRSPLNRWLLCCKWGSCTNWQLVIVEVRRISCYITYTKLFVFNLLHVLTPSY